MEFDLGNLTAYDPSPIDKDSFVEGIEVACHGMATKVFQALTQQLFHLPSEAALEGRIVQLPPPVTLLPREKPLPKPRAPTKWEMFAQRKGIVKRKRSKLEWDEASGEWRRRHGYKKANDEEATPILEAKPGEETGVEDPFASMRKEKKQRVKKQEDQQLKNLKASAKAGGNAALPPTLKLAAALPEHGRGRPSKRKELHSELKAITRQVTASTASMGRYDRAVAGENPKERARAIGSAGMRQRKSFVDSFEKESKVVNRILSQNADDIDLGKAIGRLEAASRDQRKEYRMKQKGANKKRRLEKQRSKK